MSNPGEQQSPNPDAAYEAEMAVQRALIDDVDTQLVALINRRAEIAQEVGRIKIQFDKPIFVSSREEAVLDRASAHNNSEVVPDEDIRTLFSAIMKTSRAAQQRLFDSEATEGQSNPEGKA